MDTQHITPDAQKRKMLYTGKRFDDIERPTATQRADGAGPK